MAIATHGLRKTYRKRGRFSVAVEGLDLAVPAGGVHGFLGPNGSGKTTTIKMLLGLVRADAGEMRIFDVPVPQRLPDVVSRVGAIVESPKFFPSFSGRGNLELLARAIGAPRSRVDAVLHETSLGAAANDRYQGYSLGMKQRLAVAATLLKDPQLLIFDEPTNGLDPQGIRDIRQTMRNLGASGRTVLVSSHILAEVEQVADTVSIIGRGRLLAAGSVADILGAGGGTKVRVGVADPRRAGDILHRAGHDVTADGEALLVGGVEDAAVITRALADEGLYVHELTTVRPDLESAFLALTSGAQLGSEAPPAWPGGPGAAPVGAYGAPYAPTGQSSPGGHPGGPPPGAWPGASHHGQTGPNGGTR